MAKTCKNPEAEITKGQTWGLFKITRKDYRKDISSRKINRGEFSELMNSVYKVAEKSGWKPAVVQAEAERLLANFPSI